MNDYIAENNRSITRDLEAGDYWPLTYNDNGATRNYNITVWKVTSSAVYIRVFIDDRTDSTNYIKLTTAQNSDILNQLLIDKCDKSYTTVTIGSTSISTFIDGAMTASSSTEQRDNDFTYRYVDSLPAFLTIYNNTLTTHKFDNDDKPTGTETYTYTLGTQSSVTLTASYKDPTITQPINYCVPKVNATSHTYDLPYEMDCTTDDTVGVGGFVPKNEL